MSEKGKYVVLFTSGNFVFFKHKNEKGVYCNKNILNSPRTILKDDIYDLTVESVTQKHRKDWPDMPEAAVLIATKAKYVKTPRTIYGVGTMKKISQDGEYGFVEYQDGSNLITAFCTRITVRPAIEKGGMLKFFTTGCKVRFVAKEQPPSGMFKIEWRAITVTDMKHEIAEGNPEKVTPVSQTAAVIRPVAVAAAAPPRPATAAAAARPTSAVPAAVAAATMAPPPGLAPLPAAAPITNGVSASSSTSSVNGPSYAERAGSKPIPEGIAAAARAVRSPLPLGQVIDENLPATCFNPRFFGLSELEKTELRSCGFSLKDAESPSVNIYEAWPHYKREEERSLESFEAELSQLSRVATALYGGDSHVCAVSFTARLVGS